MKSSKLIDIFKNGNIVIPIYLLKNLDKLKLEIHEFIFLMYLYNLGDKFLFDPTKFSESLNIDFTEVMGYISSLTEKKFIRVEVLKNRNARRSDGYAQLGGRGNRCRRTGRIVARGGALSSSLRCEF